ncbi:protein with hydrophobic anchor, partial [Listeria monocytogenes]|nr:protein with hydrophobic anchor [Listeria monocytogenes]
ILLVVIIGLFIYLISRHRKKKKQL